MPVSHQAPRAAVAAIDVIRDGIEILERHPFIGRSCEEGLRAGAGLAAAYVRSFTQMLHFCEPYKNKELASALD